MNSVFKNETKNTHRIEWLRIACYVLGCIFGRVMIHVINTREHIHNGAGRFVVEVLIITCCILLIETARFGINKLVRRS